MMAVLADRVEIARLVYKKTQKLAASEVGKDGKSTTTTAAESGKASASSYLETKDRTGRTALHCAAHKVCQVACGWAGAVLIMINKLYG